MSSPRRMITVPVTFNPLGRAEAIETIYVARRHLRHARSFNPLGRAEAIETQLTVPRSRG